MDAQEAWLSDFGQLPPVLIVGSGLSSALSGENPLANWGGLIESAFDLLASMRPEIKDETAGFANLLKIATDSSAALYLSAGEYVRNIFSQSEGEYTAWLRRTVGSLQAKTETLHPSFASGIPILTTNYDDLIEQVTGRTPITWRDSDEFDYFYEEPAKYVFHLHGHYKSPSSVILGGQDYGRLESAPVASKVLENLVHQHTFLLAGFGAGLEDPHFATFKSWFDESFAHSARRVYVATKSDKLPSKLIDGRFAYISYGEKYEQLPTFLQTMLSSVEPAGTSYSPETPLLGEHEEAELTDVLSLPPAVAAETTRALGGDLTKLSEFQRRMLQLSGEIVDARRSGLVAAVTGTGKTTLARVAMNTAIAVGGSAVMILPTKALVAQEVAEWDSWVNAWSIADKEISVYGSSRDYPENDSPIARGRYHVAVAIYEKLAAYIVNGRNPLRRARLLVIDELQTLAEDGDRAVKLEGLLTMVRLMPPTERPAILGLSATLSEQASKLLLQWLDVPRDRFLQTTSRPIPLDTIVMDGTTSRRQPDAHLLAFGTDGVTVPDFVDSTHNLLKRLSPTRLAKIQVRELSTAPLAAALADDLLREDRETRILIFVPTRTAAQELASAVHYLIKERMGTPSRKESPWLGGRFASGTTNHAEAELRFTRLKNSGLPFHDEVIHGLRHGVAFHSARLPAEFRRLLESEFRDPNGILRALIATDTLAVGVNLPADVVIASSIAGYTSDRQRELLTAADLDNKAGRAGRRGQARRARGTFYILVPSDRELQAIQGITAAGIRALSTKVGVFERYVMGSDRVPPVLGRIHRLDDVARLVLQVLCYDGYTRTEANLAARVESVIHSLLAHQSGATTLPTVESVIGRLRSLQLLSGGEKSGPTKLGRALARSGLTLNNAGILERLSRLAVAGAGDIDLLYNAFRSPEMEAVSAWVSLPGVDRRHFPDLKESILGYTFAYTADDIDKRRLCEQALELKRYPLPERLLEAGSKVVSTDLKELLGADIETVGDRDANALLRALVAYEWSQGIPFSEIKARFGSAIKSDQDLRPKERRPELSIHYSDVEQLCEQAAGILNGAAQVSVSDDNVDWSGRMINLALRVETGLPVWLGRIARLRMPQFHRNRLAILWEHAPVLNDWSEILDLKPLVDDPGLSEEDRHLARERLEVEELREKTYRHRVASEWGDKMIPDLSLSIDEFGEELERAIDAETYVQLLNEMANALGIVASGVTGGELYSEVTWSGPESSISVIVPEKTVNEILIEDVRGRVVYAIMRTRLAPSGEVAIGETGSVARFIQPEQLLTIVGRLIELRAEAVTAEEVLQEIRGIRVSALTADSWSVSESSDGAPPPFPGRLQRLEHDQSDVSEMSEEDAP